MAATRRSVRPTASIAPDRTSFANYGGTLPGMWATGARSTRYSKRED